MSLVYVGIFPQLPLPAQASQTAEAVTEIAAAITALAARHVVVAADARILPCAETAEPAQWPALREITPWPLSAPGAVGLLFTALRQAGWQGRAHVTAAPAEGGEALGRAIGNVLNDDSDPCALLAYGRLACGPGGGGSESAPGGRLAQIVLQGLKRDTVLLRGVPSHLLEEQNLYNALLVALGAREGEPRVLAYESLAGAGYLAAEIYRSSPVARFARACLIHHLAGRSLDDLIIPEEPLLREPAACFVTLKKEGDLRGCIGTVIPTRADLAAEIKHNTVAAATQDPRFWPVTADEPPLISISVDVLGPMEAVGGLNELDPFEYGVVVRCRGKSGILLPRLEGIEDARQQVDIARQKAGIWPEEAIELRRFRAARYHE
ncbi:MAG: AmmeMemoRadiSam system protein A [Gracilibacteraceae bacterium]|jgi:AmmeMemoRadiSam system protein A|nr:AmmeMemoRadiSam system protein A [Gracilibacteraceae bacterium]